MLNSMRGLRHEKDSVEWDLSLLRTEITSAVFATRKTGLVYAAGSVNRGVSPCGQLTRL